MARDLVPLFLLKFYIPTTDVPQWFSSSFLCYLNFVPTIIVSFYLKAIINVMSSKAQSGILNPKFYKAAEVFKGTVSQDSGWDKTIGRLGLN
jgi:hypothetical protein